MGRIRNAAEAMGLAGSSVTRESTIPLVSPYITQTSHFGQALVLKDIYGDTFRPVIPVTVDDAMQVPAIVKGVALLHAIIARRPMVAYRGDVKVTPQPAWMSRSDDGVPPQVRTARILDDHIFHNITLLHIDSRGADGFPLSISHIDFERWEQEPDGTLLLDKEPTDGTDFMVIPGPWSGKGGLLKHGSQIIRDSRNLARSASSRALNPIPAYEIRVTGDEQPSDEELDALKAKVLKDRMDPNGAVIVMGAGLELHSHGGDAIDLHESGRNALRQEIGLMLAIPASLLEGISQGSSLDYSNTMSKAGELYAHTLSHWLTPIEAWLSQDNVMPHGQSVRFDFSDYLSPYQPGTTGAPITED